MTRTVHVTLYQFDELPTDAAKEKAREWYREASAGDSFWSESVIEDAETIAGLMGIEFARRTFQTMGGGTGTEPRVFWSFYTQGSGASFEGTWTYKANSLAAVKDHAPIDPELHRIATILGGANLAGLRATLTANRLANHYTHERTIDIEVERDDEDRPEVTKEQDDEVTEALRDYMTWIHDHLEKEYEYQNADEQIDENMTANEYEFHEDGRRARD